MIKAEAQRQRSRPGELDIDWGNPEQASRPIREYLVKLEQANPAPPLKRVTPTDPASNWTAAAGGQSIVACSTNCLIYLKAWMIVDVKPLAMNKTDEVEPAKTMIDRADEKFFIKLPSIGGDTNSGVPAMLGWLGDQKGIAPHVPYGINSNVMTQQGRPVAAVALSRGIAANLLCGSVRYSLQPT